MLFALFRDKGILLLKTNNYAACIIRFMSDEKGSSLTISGWRRTIGFVSYIRFLHRNLLFISIIADVLTDSLCGLIGFDQLIMMHVALSSATKCLSLKSVVFFCSSCVSK